MLNLRRCGILAAISLVCLFALAACGDDDDGPGDVGSSGGAMTLQEYFDELDVIFARADAATDAAEEQLDEDSGNAQEFADEVDAVEIFLDEVITAFDDAIADMEELDPPGEVTEAHDDFLDAASAAADGAGRFLDELEGVDDRSEADELVSEFDSEVTALIRGADEACLDLQVVANQNDIDVDLNCEE
jgi:hypothetical protein